MEPEDEGHRNNRWSLERMRSAQQQRVEPSNSLEEKKKKTTPRNKELAYRNKGWSYAAKLPNKVA